MFTPHRFIPKKRYPFIVGCKKKKKEEEEEEEEEEEAKKKSLWRGPFLFKKMSNFKACMFNTELRHAIQPPLQKFIFHVQKLFHKLAFRPV
jgi:hypothetical protein